MPAAAKRQQSLMSCGWRTGDRAGDDQVRLRHVQQGDGGANRLRQGDNHGAWQPERLAARAPGQQGAQRQHGERAPHGKQGRENEWYR